MCGDVSLVILAREKEKKIHFMRKEYDFSLELKKKKKKKKKKAPIIFTIFLHHSLGGEKKKGKTQIHVTKKLSYCQELRCLIS